MDSVTLASCRIVDRPRGLLLIWATAIMSHDVLLNSKSSMTTLEVKLDLPESLAKEAQQAGLLTPQAIETMLREAVRSRRIARLMEARRNVDAAGISPLTIEEIQAEIESDRAERRGKLAG